MKIKIIEKILTLNDNLELIGSNSNVSVKYKTDYDYQEVINKSVNDTVPLIQKMFKDFDKVKDCYVVDFKAGFSGNEPIRWDKYEVANGFKIVESKRINLVDYLGDGSTVKIDIIAYIDGEYHEVSCNYYFLIDLIIMKSFISKLLPISKSSTVSILKPSLK